MDKPQFDRPRLDIRKLKKDDVVNIKTLNSSYRIKILDPAKCLVEIKNSTGNVPLGRYELFGALDPHVAFSGTGIIDSIVLGYKLVLCQGISGSSTKKAVEIIGVVLHVEVNDIQVLPPPIVT